ncbi:hypothetical protein TEA_018363 [Camellia sinensis var. sinensis]|uniref:Uncharacterized protein n=1 Tax=Camellia sinensis var. sinensis TaxID=542762 RepID=A0A4S4DL87_CAMSN|nr:hypothetical protein TEA_018363 [Camellia sinensis var. sinensis]
MNDEMSKDCGETFEANMSTDLWSYIKKSKMSMRKDCGGTFKTKISTNQHKRILFFETKKLSMRKKGFSSLKPKLWQPRTLLKSDFVTPAAGSVYSAIMGFQNGRRRSVPYYIRGPDNAAVAEAIDEIDRESCGRNGHNFQRRYKQCRLHITYNHYHRVSSKYIHTHRTFMDFSAFDTMPQVGWSSMVVLLRRELVAIYAATRGMKMYIYCKNVPTLEGDIVTHFQRFESFDYRHSGHRNNSESTPEAMCTGGHHNYNRNVDTGHSIRKWSSPKRSRRLPKLCANAVDKNAIKFKTKPLEHMDLMRRVYEGATTTGKYTWTPGAAFEPVAPDDGTSQAPDEDCEDSSGLPPFQPAAQHEHTVQHTVAQEDGTPATMHAASSGINADDTPTSGMNKRKSPGPTHPQRKRGQSEGASLLASSMENLASSVKLQRRQIRVSHDYANSAQHLIQKCMTRLHSLEGLDPQDPPVPFAQSVLDNPANPAIMMSIPTDTAVTTWLRTKKSREQCIGGPSVANPEMGGGWF